jgi:type IV pilus assembly protein PilB
MVLTTLHTNDAPSAISRLIEMGIEPFLVGSALDSVLAQRLCRMLCKECREAYTPTERELAEVRFPHDPSQPLPLLYRAVGCAACARTGYYGRMALHEVMTVTEEIERLAVARASTDEIEKMASAQGMTSLREDGWLRVARGLTSIEEILRVVA